MWATNFVLGRYLGPYLTPPVITAVRFSVATLIMIPLWLGQPAEKRAIPRQVWLPVFLGGVTGYFSYSLLMYWGLRHTTAMNSTLVNALNPVAIILLARLILGDPLRPRALVGIMLSVAGVTWIVTQHQLGRLLSLELDQGALIFLAGNVVWAIFTVVGKVAVSRISTLTFTTGSLLVGTVLTWTVALRSVVEFFQTPGSLSFLPVLIYIGIFPSMLAFLAWNEALRRVGPGPTGLAGNSLPVFASLLSITFLGETLTVDHLVGGGLILLGVFLGTSEGWHPSLPSRTSETNLHQTGSRVLEKGKTL